MYLLRNLKLFEAQDPCVLLLSCVSPCRCGITSFGAVSSHCLGIWTTFAPRSSITWVAMVPLVAEHPSLSLWNLLLASQEPMLWYRNYWSSWSGSSGICVVLTFLLCCWSFVSFWERKHLGLYWIELDSVGCIRKALILYWEKQRFDFRFAEPANKSLLTNSMWGVSGGRLRLDAVLMS